MKRNIYLLDCTLRDGGFALEGKNSQIFSYSKEVRSNVAQNLTDAGVDIIELGTLEAGEVSKRGYAIFPNMNEISKLIPKNADKKQMYAVFFRGPDIPIEYLPDWNEELCCLIRLGVRYSEMDKSLDYCRRLCEKGYLVSVQPIVTMRYTDTELEKVIEAANEINAYSLYFVDSYGSMFADDVKRIFNKYDKALKKEIKIGFHAHNNMGLASSNIIDMLSIESGRDVIIDACCMGMGQGAGNLQTEVIATYLNEKYKKKYDFMEIMRVCEYVSAFWQDNLWGYSLTTMIPAVFGVAYKYGIVLRNEYGYSYEKIANILKNVPDEMKHRYTKENLEKLLKG